VRAHFTSLINKEKNLFLNRSQQNNLQSDCAIIKAIKAMMIKINSKMKEWDTSDNSAERSAFENVQCNLQNEDKKGLSGLIQKKDSLWLFLSWHHIIFEYYSLLRVSWDSHKYWSWGLISTYWSAAAFRLRFSLTLRFSLLMSPLSFSWVFEVMYLS
jgi:hypothetical protein